MPTDLPQRPRPGQKSEPNQQADAAPTKAPAPLQAVFAAVTLAALATLVLLPVLGDHGGRREPFLVAISPPRVEQAGSLSNQHLQALLATLEDAAERHLSGRAGLLWTPVGLAAEDRDAARAARDAGADEALVLTVSCDSVCRGSLQRIRSVDASTTWQRPPFRLMLEDPLEIERTLGDQIAVAYLKFTRREGAPKLFAQVEDYRRYLNFRRQLDSTSVPANLADSLAAIRESSPRFFSTYLFEAELRARAGADDAEVLELLEDARRIAPADPRPLVRSVPLLVQEGRIPEAKDRLKDLESLYPEHPELSNLRLLLTRDPAAATTDAAKAPAVSGD